MEKRILERYFGDLQRLFLKRFEMFCSYSVQGPHEAKSLEQLFDEIVYIRSLLDNLKE
jgi:hypothetical protein